MVHPRLDVQLATDEVARQLGVERGALILKVVPDGRRRSGGLTRDEARDQAGHVQLGDVLVAIDDKPIESGDDCHSALQRYKVGDSR